jgi:coatomer subunit gamma
MSYAKKDEDADQLGFKLDRTSVFQDGTIYLPHPSFTCSNTNTPTARLFNSSPISPRRCRTLLTKIAVLLFTGEKFPTTEATTLFFGISKLFQNKDPSLRQMVYLILKELAHTAEDVIMSTSIIMKDGNLGSEHIYRANAIRALCRIIDVRSSHRANV